MTTVKPRCPYCNVQGIKYLANRQVGNYLIVFCGDCGAIYGVVPVPIGQQPQTKKEVPKPDGRAAPKETVYPFGIIGHADLSQKEPYSPQRMANRVRAARLNRGTRYMQIAEDYGPPRCSQHKVDMIDDVIPSGFPNAGVKVWVCPQFSDCQEWEIAE